MAYFGAVDSDIADDLVKAGALQESITFTRLSSEKQAKSRVVYCVLSSELLNRAPLQVLMSCPENNGYEAWRFQKHNYEPSAGSRHVAMLSNLLKPLLGENHLKFWDKFRKWGNDDET